MSKLKLPISYVTPLCLKLRGRIVGAVSRITIAMYIGAGILVVSSIVLIGVLASLKSDLGPGVRPEKVIESQVPEAVQDKPAVITIVPQAVPESVPKAIESEVLAPARPISGPVALDFGWQLHQVYNDWRYHTGIDISRPVGQPVEAIYKGQVTDIFRDKHSGLTVVVKNSTYSVYYGSLAEATVEKGSSISAGQKIGTVGSCDAEPYHHLHLAIKKGEQYIDPKLIVSTE